ncbi:cyanophycin synthetase [Micromonospora purpureochromogenes]|uniref:Cyanophycin synthetase n=1 Tax=Micromonospora purpureochromogenes TaxID=47872 RepID=A0A1C4XS36_9ACTN|nr:cyanophycin synthetase [Micromonospora purpureochromogenes]SCF11307.1 cyanophycin synthetase [Micromonospora purpureochromogenes]
MKVLDVRRLRGPNVYLDRPVQVVRVALGDLTERESNDFVGFPDRILDAFPGLAEHHCAAGEPGGFVTRLHGGTYFGHVVEHVAIEMSHLIGRPVSFGRTVSGGAAGLYDLVIECPQDERADSPLPGALLEAAILAVRQVLAGRPAEHERALTALRDQFEEEAPGPSTASIIDAARRRGIPVERVNALSLLQLGQGCRRRLAWAAMSDQTSAIGLEICGDKELTRQLLHRAGIPVPAGGPARTLPQALDLFADLGGPVAVKPVNGRQGRHVHLALDTAEAVAAAFFAAEGDVVVEQYIEGRDYRVLVVAGRVVAAAERIPGHVVGDGTNSVEELVERLNADPRRGNGHEKVLTRLRMDGNATALLRRQGLAADAVPAAGRTVWLRDTPNLSTGGTSIDVTDRVHPELAQLCGRAAAIVGLDIAGIDLRLPDIAAPPPLDGGADGALIEVNAAPGLRMHLAPSVGTPRYVGGAIVDALFPGGGDGRIPTVAVTGTNGKTTTARITAHLLAGSGLRVGLTSTDGIYLDGRLVQRADATGPRSAQAVLGDPTVQAAVLETARGGILRQGLGYDWTDVGVITNVTADHLGQDGLDTVEDVLHVKALIAERVRDGGTLVLNADDPYLRELIARPRVRAERKRLVWFSLDPDNPVVRQHCADGGTAYALAGGQLVEMAGQGRTPLLPAAELPGAFNGAARHMIANALAASAAARELGTPRQVVEAQLRSFSPYDRNPGRGTLLRVDDVHVFVDYAHNPAAIEAVARTVQTLWGADRCVAAVTLPGDRSDQLLADSARVIGRMFARVVVYPDADLRGRSAGEVPELMCREMRRENPGVRCEQAPDVAEAITKATAMSGPGDVLLVLYEKLDPVLSILRSMGARPVDAPTPAAPVAQR